MDGLLLMNVVNVMDQVLDMILDNVIVKVTPQIVKESAEVKVVSMNV